MSVENRVATSVVNLAVSQASNSAATSLVTLAWSCPGAVMTPRARIAAASYVRIVVYALLGAQTCNHRCVRGSSKAAVHGATANRVHGERCGRAAALVCLHVCMMWGCMH